MNTAIVGTLAGTALGATASWAITRDATRRERRHQEVELIRQRKEATAAALRDELPSITEAVPLGSLKSTTALPRLESTQRLIRSSWNRAALLREPSIDRCYAALNAGVVTAVLDAEEVGPSKNINSWALNFAIEDLEGSLNAYLLREPAPTPFFPDPEELRELIGSSSLGLGILHAEMRKRWLGRQVRQARAES